MKRRTFIKAGSAAAVISAGPFTGIAGNAPETQLEKDKKAVKFTRDGLDLTTREYSELLREITKTKGINPDNYSRFGVVEELEYRMAEMLGKESAVFMPTGTLANHIAVRELSGKDDRVIVQAESHLYNDSGDCAQKLSNLNLMPLAPGKATFTLDEVKNAVTRTKKGRVKTGIGVISIESPVRRKDNEMFDFETMKSITEYACENGIRLHLDGARMFNACVHSGKSPADFAKLFDTVYVSLYKDFNAASGAILAGTKEFTKDLYHVRRMFGGGMPQVWPFAAVALHYLDTFLDDYAESVKQAEKLFALLEENPAFKIEKIPNGTNVFKLYVKTSDRDRFRENLESKNIFIPAPDKTFEGFKMKINNTLLRSNPEEIAKKFVGAI